MGNLLLLELRLVIPIERIRTNRNENDFFHQHNCQSKDNDDHKLLCNDHKICSVYISRAAQYDKRCNICTQQRESHHRSPLLAGHCSLTHYWVTISNFEFYQECHFFLFSSLNYHVQNHQQSSSYYCLLVVLQSQGQ